MGCPDRPPDRAVDVEELEQLTARLAAAADLCLPPRRHALRLCTPPPFSGGDYTFRIEARDQDGCRQPDGDRELEIYRSGNALHLMLSRCDDEGAPLLWHGSHPVWMEAGSGQRCDRPEWGLPLEALARRVRALLSGG
jgi:hypothetical protein